MTKNAVLSIIALLFASLACAQDKLPKLHRPLDIPLVLSGNFGELRSNHFHSGLDFKTQGRTGLKIYCAADGYVSRILVSPWGFGRAIYVTHPQLGLVTVYGHLQSFSEKINKTVKDEQYKRETFSIDMEFRPDEIPVKSGEVIALSGNAGSSGGPHLHMDVRDLQTGDALDPMPYFKSLINDTRAPEVRQLALFPHGGVVEDSTVAVFRSPEEFSKPFTAWGKVAPAIKAYDRMPNVQNVYGVKYLQLTVDGVCVYQRVIDRFSFDISRGVNTLVEYGHRSKGLMMTSYVPRSRILGDMIATSVNDGIINIDQERDYNCCYTLTDEHGNKSSVKFTIRGKRSEIPPIKHNGPLFHFNGNNSYNLNGLKLDFPAGTFYDDIYFDVTSTPLNGYNSDAHKIGDTGIALHRNFSMEISLTQDNEANKQHYCLVRINGKKRTAVNATYNNGVMKAKVNQFGRYAVTTDKTPPKILPLRQKRWAKNGKVSFRISDNLSGIQHFRGEIDGKWVMFEYDGKSATITYRLESSRIKKGKTHKVNIVVTDACGNTQTHNSSFVW